MYRTGTFWAFCALLIFAISSQGHCLPQRGVRAYENPHEQPPEISYEEYSKGVIDRILIAKDENGREYRRFDFGQRKRSEFRQYHKFRTKEAGVAYYLNPDVSVRTGPVWIRERVGYQNTHWGLQLGIHFSLGAKKF